MLLIISVPYWVRSNGKEKICSYSFQTLVLKLGLYKVDGIHSMAAKLMNLGDQLYTVMHLCVSEL